MANSKNKTYISVSVLGKNLKLNIQYIASDHIELNQSKTQIDLILPKFYKHYNDVDVVNLAISKLYDRLAETEIEYAMEVARHILKFAPNDYSVARIKGFYMCSKGKITVNPDIVQYNRDIINTTIIQAFCKIKYKSSSKAYEEALQYGLQKYNEYKCIKSTNDLFLFSA